MYLLDWDALARLQLAEPDAERWLEDVVIDHYPVSEIVNWGCSAAVFVLAVRDNTAKDGGTSTRRLFFYTEQADVLAATVRVYTDASRVGKGGDTCW